MRKLIRVRELTVSHKLEQMRSVRMLEQRATWMRENGFDRIEVKADRHEETLRHMHAGFDPQPFYARLHSPRRPPTPEEFTLDMIVEVESLRLELLLSQPLLPQLLPRQSPAQPPQQQPCSVCRMRTDSGKMERGEQQTTVGGSLHV